MIRDDIQAALASKLAGVPPFGAAILFDLGPDGTIFLDGKASPPAVSQSGPAADTTIKVTSADLAAMMAGELNPIEAYTTGRLEVDGDMAHAMTLGSLLG